MKKCICIRNTDANFDVFPCIKQRLHRSFFLSSPDSIPNLQRPWSFWAWWRSSTSHVADPGLSRKLVSAARNARSWVSKSDVIGLNCFFFRSLHNQNQWCYFETLYACCWHVVHSRFFSLYGSIQNINFMNIYFWKKMDRWVLSQNQNTSWIEHNHNIERLILLTSFHVLFWLVT